MNQPKKRVSEMNCQPPSLPRRRDPRTRTQRIDEDDDGDDDDDDMDVGLERDTPGREEEEKEAPPLKTPLFHNPFFCFGSNPRTLARSVYLKSPGTARRRASWWTDSILSDQVREWGGMVTTTNARKT